MTDWANPAISLSVGVAFTTTPIVYLTYRRLRKRQISISLRAAIIVAPTKENRAEASGGEDEFWHYIARPVPGYKFGEEFAELLPSVFAENRALEKQWHKLIPEDCAQGSDHQDGIESPGSRLIHEIGEFILLERLASHLQDYYYSEAVFDETQLVRLSRTDLPEILLSNRVLETFSRDLADRPAFVGPKLDSADDATLVSAWSADGLYYSRLELVLPKGSTVSRSKDRTLWIRNRSISFGLRVSFNGGNVYVPPEFFIYYLTDQNNNAFMHPHLEVDIEITAIIGGRFVAYSKNIAYYEWLDSFLSELREEVDFRAFLKSLPWATVQANARAFAAIQHRSVI